MSEYIELKKRCVYAGDVIAEPLKGGMELEAAILFANNLPTADVVEVKHAPLVFESDFCSYGERKDGAEDA